ncbi:hypothetical protein JHL21_12420 [Devosia sp. WQ 349]|uniref:hypothetical protein n=1 Tax=Devosia sp. WQ 349K1 TaxID=2800329 RepID=UPI001908E84D|nr:hypothetical protein [Devosia sp. WQ 349K1]MBK1795301.1 hypothetical protein [Devosia sp. WQ 349K1]
MMRLRAVLPITAVIMLTASPLNAAETAALSRVPDQTVFAFAGVMHAGHFSDSLEFWSGPYEANVAIGAGYQNFFYSYGSFGLGVEVGAALRAGESTSGEIWAGGVARLTTFEVGPLNITPSLTAGFSVVSDPIGVEAVRARTNNASPYFLYYLSPEIAVSHDNAPEIEVFGRIHHRSGGFGTIAHLDGSNAAVLGIRYRF